MLTWNLTAKSTCQEYAQISTEEPKDSENCYNVRIRAKSLCFSFKLVLGRAQFKQKHCPKWQPKLNGRSCFIRNFGGHQPKLLSLKPEIISSLSPHRRNDKPETCFLVLRPFVWEIENDRRMEVQSCHQGLGHHSICKVQHSIFCPEANGSTVNAGESTSLFICMSWHWVPLGRRVVGTPLNVEALCKSQQNQNENKRADFTNNILTRLLFY